jgi:nicotinamidase-related amidase
MTTIELLDRNDFVRTMNDALRIDPAHTAVLTIDMHRGHLDPDIATMRVPPDEAADLVQNTAVLLRAARAAGMRVMHSVTVRRAVEAASPNSFQRTVAATGQTVAPGLVMNPPRHNLEGSPQCELMPGLALDPDDLVLANKKQFSSFCATDLANLIRVLGVDTLVMTGVGTNTCVLSTALDAFNLGLRVIVVADCTTSLNGVDLHLFALENMRRTIGWVLTVEDVVTRCKAEPAEHGR